MYLKIMIDLDNVAFESDEELPRVLRSLANEYGYSLRNDLPLYDCNGNRVGKATLHHEFMPE